MPIDFLFVLLGFVAGPLLLTATAGFMGWRHRRDLWRKMHDAPRPAKPSLSVPDSPREGPPPSLTAAADAGGIPPGSAAEEARREALGVNVSVQRAYVTAWLVYAAVVVGFIVRYTSPTIGWDGRLGIAYVVLAPQLMIVTWAIRLSLRRRLLMFAVYVALGGVLLLLLAGTDRTLVVVRYVIGPFALFPMVGLLFLFVRRVQPFLVLLIASFIHFIGFALLLDRFRLDVTIGSKAALQANPWLLLYGLSNIVLGVVVAGALLRTQRGVLMGVVAALAGTLLLDRDLAHHNLPLALRMVCYLAVAVLQVFILWSLFKLFVWFQERRFLTNELLQTHLCWAFLTLCVAGSTAASDLYRDRIAVRWGLVLALALHAVVLHALFFHLRRQRPKRPEKRLLLLRVFGRAEEREDLLDHLNDNWRRLGAVDLIAATDVASRTLQSSMLEAFLLRRSDEQFLRTEAEVDERLTHRSSEIEADVRYPVNPVYCYENIWHQAFSRLADESSVVLMDVRGFTSANEGCAWELTYLLQHDPPLPIVLLADRRTDRQALGQILRAASPAERELTILDFERKSEEERRALFDLLLKAAYA